MATTNQEQSLKYDFSGLSKGRLRAYNHAVQELENMQQDVRDLDDSELEMLSAAGIPFNGVPGKDNLLK